MGTVREWDFGYLDFTCLNSIYNRVEPAGAVGYVPNLCLYALTLSILGGPGFVGKAVRRLCVEQDAGY